MSTKDDIFKSKILNWFKKEGRNFYWRENRLNPYEILILEVMLQKTVATNVAKIFPKFIDRYSKPECIQSATIEDLESIITPLGIYKRKALAFKKISRRIIEEYGGNVPREKEELLSLYMVGEYVANAVLCFGYCKHIPLLDVNVKRLINRSYSLSEIDEIRNKLKEIMDGMNPKLFNWALIDFGNLICKKTRPLCNKCQINEICRFYKQSN